MISFLQRRLSVIANPAPQVSENELLEMPGLKPLRPRLLSDALASCQQLLAAATGDEALSEEIDRSHFRVAPILEGLGDKTAALDEYQAALSSVTRHLAADTGSPSCAFISWPVECRTTNRQLALLRKQASLCLC